MKKILTLSLALLAYQFIWAQTEKSEIATDRPDQTESPSLVPKGGLQVETGFVFESDRNLGLLVRNYTYNTSLIKYGVNENLELRFITEYVGQWSKFENNAAIDDHGISPIALGVKMKISEENGFWPQAAFIGHLNFRTGDKNIRPTYSAADFRFTFAHTLSDRWALSYNLGAQWDGESAEATYLYTLSLACVITPKLDAYIESYSFFPEYGKADHRFDAGITYKITSVVQYDISGGFGINNIAPDYFVSTGLSFRLFK